MKKVLWFSRHDMSADQLEDLNRIFGDVKITKVSKTISAADEIKNEIDAADIIAVVAPIELQAEIIKLAKGKPVISSRSKRVLLGDDKIQFLFDGWYRIHKIDIVTENL